MDVPNPIHEGHPTHHMARKCASFVLLRELDEDGFDVARQLILTRGKRMKTTTILFVISMAFSTFANGIYFVSGANFKPASIKYVLETTQPNETIEVCPTGLRLLTIFGNIGYRGDWSLSVGNKEWNYDYLGCLRQA